VERRVDKLLYEINFSGTDSVDESKIQSQTDRETDRQKTMPIADHTASSSLRSAKNSLYLYDPHDARQTCLWTSPRFSHRQTDRQTDNANS